MSIPYEAKAAAGLEQLGLKVARQHLDQVAPQAAAGRWSYTHFLGYLLDGELEERRRRSIELSLQFARFPYRKRLEDFDYAAQPSIDRRLVEELATGRFAADGRNVVLLGPAALDRLLHRATVLNVRGDSYRMKGHDRAGGGRVEVTEARAAEQREQAPGQSNSSRRKLEPAGEEVSA